MTGSLGGTSCARLSASSSGLYGRTIDTSSRVTWPSWSEPLESRDDPPSEELVEGEGGVSRRCGRRKERSVEARLGGAFVDLVEEAVVLEDAVEEAVPGRFELERVCLDGDEGGLVGMSSPMLLEK